MTTIHVITMRTNRDSYQDILDEYFRLRHEIFVSERGWRDLHQTDGREIDAYDNDDAIYLLALDGDRVVGGQRLYPTVLPHMMSEVFGHMAPTRPPKGAACSRMDALFRR